MDSGTILMQFSLSQLEDLLEVIRAFILDMIKTYPRITNNTDMTTFH